MDRSEILEKKWNTLSLAEQLGNIGSEYSRFQSAFRSNNQSRLVEAEKRFFELMDLTLRDHRWAGARRRELARLREQTAMDFYNASPSGDMQKYFDYFVLASRQN